MPTIQGFCVDSLEMWPTEHLAQGLAESSFSVTVFIDGPEEAGQREGRKNSMHRVPRAWYAEGEGETCKEYYIRARDEVVSIKDEEVFYRKDFSERWAMKTKLTKCAREVLLCREGWHFQRPRLEGVSQGVLNPEKCELREYGWVPGLGLSGVLFVMLGIWLQ